MGLLHRIGGGEIIVLAGVDDHAGVSVDGAGEVLVHQGALHVDVSEQDAIQGVVEHHVQALEGAHGGDLGHAQAGAVVAHPDVAAHLGPHLVHGLAHQAEVLLSGVGAAEALGGGPIGDVVQQRLAGGADDGDDVGALPGGGGRLGDVLIDVTGGHDQIDPGPLLVAVLGQEVLPALPAGGDLRHGLPDHRVQDRLDLGAAVGGQRRQVQFAGGDRLGNFLGRLAGGQHGVAHPEGRALGQGALAGEMLHHHVGQGHLELVDPVDAQQAAHRPLHRHGGVAVDEPLGVVGHLGRVGPRLLYQFKIQVQL